MLNWILAAMFLALAICGFARTVEQLADPDELDGATELWTLLSVAGGVIGCAVFTVRGLYHLIGA